MSHFDVAGQRGRIDGEPVVLGGDLDLAGVEFLHRVIGPSVPELQLVGGPAHGETEYLMAQADAEHGHARRNQHLRVVDGVGHGGGIPGAVAQEHAVRARREQLLRRRCCRVHANAAPVRAQPPEDVPLHAEVVCRNLQPPLGTVLRRDIELVRIFVWPIELPVRGHAAHQVSALHPRNRIRRRHQGLRVHRVSRGDHAALDATRAQLPGQCARVDVRDGDDPVRREVLAQRAGGSPVAGHGRLVANDKAGHVRLPRLDIARRDAVVTDLGRRHRDDLAGVGRVREDLLIAGHTRVEHDLATRLPFGARRHAPVDRAVLES